MDASNNRKPSGALPTIFGAAIFGLALESSAQIAPPFSNASIVSDFGPRKGAASFFHGGLDYAQTPESDIEAIEGGVVLFVRGNDGDPGGWRMKVSGNQTNRDFFYMHTRHPVAIATLEAS